MYHTDRSDRSFTTICSLLILSLCVVDLVKASKACLGSEDRSVPLELLGCVDFRYAVSLFFDRVDKESVCENFLIAALVRNRCYSNRAIDPSSPTTRFAGKDPKALSGACLVDLLICKHVTKLNSTGKQHLRPGKEQMRVVIISCNLEAVIKCTYKSSRHALLVRWVANSCVSPKLDLRYSISERRPSTFII